MRILLIEDDEKVSSLVARGLKEAGFAVDRAADGEKGLHLALTEPYDTAVVDLMLPKIDGMRLIEEVRRQKVNTPILILSAKRSLDDRVRGLQGGSDDYLTKPFAFSELLARVQALIRRASAVSEPHGLAVGDLSINFLTRVVKRGDKTIDLQPKEFVTASVEEGLDEVSLSVNDTGPGISDRDLPHIFDRFFRGDRSRVRPGAGLGLNLSLAIARAHGGDIKVTSAAGKGSTFRMTLPRSPSRH